MSQEVDERVVKLSFDNEKFEKNVKQSIHSLRALNDSLRLDGAEKGFEEVEKASEQVDFDKVQGAVETLSAKFSALEVVGVTALVRITNKAIDAGERLAKSLSIDQVTAGWSKYAEKTASVQTIMNATGKSITKVNRYLDKLMWYSDETSYGFNDMTASLGQLTAAGGDIDKLVPMIMGIANATAYAGKGAAEFKRVIYNLNQSYSQGYLNLMDWKSVELAGVATAELKKQLIQTGVELGKIKEGDVNIGTFNTSLSKKWADKQVMETAFGKLAEFSEAVKNRVDEMDDPYYQTADAIEDLADQYDEVTVKAFKAAQEAKSFSEVVDATKDAVSTGWMKTFDILFGNYDEAKKFWTDLAGEFWTIFAGGADGRNSWLKAGLDSGLDQLLDNTALGDVGDSFTELLQKSLIDSGKITAEDIEEAGSFQKAMEEAGITAQDLYDQVQLSLAVYKEAANLSDTELKGYNVSRETLEKTIASYEKMAEAIQNGEVSLEDYADQMSRMSGREHFYAGILNILEGINSVLVPIRAAFNEVFMTDGSPLYNFLKGFDELTAKFALSDETGKKVQKVFKGVFSVLSVGFKVIKTAGRIALAVLEALLGKLEPLGDLLLSVGAAFGDVFTKLNDSLNSAESFEDVITAIATAFGTLIQPLKDIFGALKALVTGSSIEEAGSRFSAFGKIVNAVNGIFQNFGLGTISLSGLIGKALRVLGGIFYVAFDGVRTLIANAFGGFKDAGKAVEEFKDNNLDTLTEVRDTVVSLPEKAGAAMKAFAGTVSTGFYTIAGAVKEGLKAVKNFFDMQDLDLYRLLSLLDVGLLAAAIWSAAEATSSLGKNIKDIFKNPIADFFTSMSKAVDSWTAAHTSKNLVGAAKAISTSVALIAGSIYLVSRINDPNKLQESLYAIMIAMFSMVVSLRALASTDLTGISSMKLFGTMGSIALGMVALSAAMGTIYAVISAFGKMDQNQLQQGTTAMVNLVVQLGICIAALGVANSKLIVSKKFALGLSTKGAGSFVAAALGLAVLAGAVVAIGKAANTETLDNAIKVIKATALALSACVIAMGVADWMSRKNSVASMIKAIAMIGKLAMLATALGALGAAMISIAGAVFIFSQIGNLWTSVIAAGAVLAGLVAAIIILGKNKLETTVAAVSILALSGALIVIAEAINLLAEVPILAMIKAIAALAISFLGLVVAAKFLPKASAEILTVAKAVGLLAASLLILTPAFKGLASLSWREALAGLIGMASIVSSVLAMSTAIAIFPALGLALILLGAACDSFATSALKLSAGLAIIAGLSFFAGPISEAIIGAAPDIELALLTILQVISDVLVLGQEYIVSAITALVEIVVQTILDLIGWAWDGNGAGGGIKQALSDLIDDAIQLVKDKFWASGSIFDIGSWIDTFTAKDRPIGKLLNWLFSPNGTEIEDAGNNLKKMLGIETEKIQNEVTPEEAAEQKAQEEEQKRLADEKNKQKQQEKAQKAAELQKQRQEDVKRRSNIVPDLKAQQEQQRAAEKAAEANKKNADATKDTVDAVKINAEKTEEYADNTEHTANAMALGVKSANEVGTGMVRIVDDTGHWYDVTVDQAKAMIDNGEATEATAGSIEEATGAVNGMTGSVQTANGNMVQAANNAATAVPIVEKAETEVQEQTGEVTAAMDETVETGVTDAGDTADESGGWIGSRIWNGIVDYFKGVNTGELTNAVSGAVRGVMAPYSTNIHSGSRTDMDDAFNSWYEKQIASYRNNNKTLADLVNDYLPPISNPTDDDPTNPTGTGSKTKGTGSTKQKTAAEVIADKYKTALEKNKQLREAADTGYELWLAENENTASAEELAAKRAENIQNDIDRQSERVNLALQQYNELAALGKEAESEARDAWNDYLSEKKDLETLRATQYTDLYKEANEAADKNLDLLEAQYDLDSTKGERTDTKEQKRKREEEYLKSQKKDLDKKVENAQAQYDYLTKTLGYAETDQRVQDALKDLLDAQKEAADLENQIAEKQLEEIEIRLEDWENDHKKVTSRMERLAQVYGDGDLSARKDDYQNAVDTYGKNSAEARKAKYEGTTSAILAAVTAFQNLNYQMGYTKNLEEQLANAKEEDKADIEAQIRDSESAFLGFAENLADAFNMDTYGKRAVLKLANGMQKNRGKLAETWNNNVLPWLTEKNPALVEAGGTMAHVMSEAFGETWAEVGTESISTIVSLMQGDWANALASGANLMMEVAFNKEVQDTLLKGVNTVFSVLQNENVQNTLLEYMGELGTGLKTLGLNFQNLGQVAMAVLGGQAGGATGIAGALGSIVEVVGQVGGILAGFLAEAWPFILAAVAVVGVIAGIAWLVNRKGQDAGKNLDQSVADGVTDNKDKVTDSIRDMTDDATDTMTDAINTIRRLTGDEYEYTPCITPVVDLTNVTESKDAMDEAFGLYDLSGTASQALAAKVDAQAEIQNGMKNQGNEQLLTAVLALGDRMDGVGESIRGMKLTVDGKRTIGYIDSELGTRAARRMR